MKEIYLNGHRFEVKRSKYANVESLSRYAGRTIYDCYSRPSSTKLSIYKEWKEWAYLNDIMYFGVRSYNINMFTLQGLVEYNENTYMLDITPSHNYAYLIDNK